MFKSNFNIVSANSGKEALKILEGNHMDAMISDWNMLEIDGLEFIKNAKIIKPEIPYYILSSYCKNEEIHQVISDGTIACCLL